MQVSPTVAASTSTVAIPMSQLQNTIIAGNNASTDPDIVGNVDATTADSNLIGVGIGSSISGLNGVSGNQIGPIGGQAIDPMLGPLENNGGAVQTILPETGSPVLALGDPSAATNAGLTTDGRGRPALHGRLTERSTSARSRDTEAPGDRPFHHPEHAACRSDRPRPIPSSWQSLPVFQSDEHYLAERCFQADGVTFKSTTAT